MVMKNMIDNRIYSYLGTRYFGPKTDANINRVQHGSIYEVALMGFSIFIISSLHLPKRVKIYGVNNINSINDIREMNIARADTVLDDKKIKGYSSDEMLDVIHMEYNEVTEEDKEEAIGEILELMKNSKKEHYVDKYRQLMSTKIKSAKNI